MDMSLGTLQEIVEDREAWRAVAMKWERIDKTEQLNNNNKQKCELNVSVE